jgi:hypothetical protein
MPSKQPGRGTRADNVSAGKSCFRCHSLDHQVKDCPTKLTAGQSGSRQVGGSRGGSSQLAKVSACSANALGEGRGGRRPGGAGERAPVEGVGGDSVGKRLDSSSGSPTGDMRHSKVAKSQACLADSMLRPIPLGLGDLVSGAADCRDGTSCEARVVEAMGTRDDAAVAVCDDVDGKITG